MRARYYDPMIGRFASEDPSHNAHNWLGYCEANPVNKFDADGKVSIWSVPITTDILAAILDLLATAFWKSQPFSPLTWVVTVIAVLGTIGAVISTLQAAQATLMTLQNLNNKQSQSADDAVTLLKGDGGGFSIADWNLEQMIGLL